MDPPPRASRIPLFPLRTVLFPGGLLPLQIFEVRYLDMIGRCHKAGAPFGVVCLTEGSEVRQRAAGDRAPEGFAREAFHDVGTLATIDDLQRPQPGLLTVRCTGTTRFRLLATELLKHGLWTAEVQPIDADRAVAVPADLARYSLALQRLLGRLQGEAPAPLALQPPYGWDDSGWLANRWCELLPLPLDERQRLMALDNPLLRLELVADWLDRFDLGELKGGTA